jgi:CheY-like chemotaxis protein
MAGRTGPWRVCRNPMRILLVEDNTVNQVIMRRLLEKRHCDVTIANHGGEALEVMRSVRFDLVFMDCQMPVMDGFDACRAIRELDSGISSVPVVAFTASATDGAVERCLAAGMDDYIAKPVSKDELDRVLRRYQRVAQ